MRTKINFIVFDKLRESELEEGSADSLLLIELSKAIENYVELERPMEHETKILAEYIRTQAGPLFKPPFTVRSPEDSSRVDQWLSKKLLRLKPHWIIINSKGNNPFGCNGGWFITKTSAETFAKIMNELENE